MIRRRRGLSQDVVAGLAGIGKQYLSMLELGQRGFNRRGLLEDLAAALGCSMADLTGQPYLPPDRESARAKAVVAQIERGLNEAGRIALSTGERNGLRQHFGPTNVNVWRIAIGAELGQGPAVAERAEREPIDLNVLGSKDRTAALHFDLARSWAQAEGDRDSEAVRHLDAADRIAPTRIRKSNDAIARDLVLTLDRRARHRVWELDSLRNRFGIDGHGPRSVDN